MATLSFSPALRSSCMATLATLGLLAASATAQATALTFEDFVQGSQLVSLTNSAPATSGTYSAGEQLLSKDDGGIVSVLRAYSVDIFQAASSSAQPYTLVDGITHFGAERADDLGRLFTEFDAWNGQTSITAQETGALQMAIWEIVNETATIQGALKFNIASGSFNASSTGPGTAAMAQGWLHGLDSVTSGYSISAYENANYQDYLVLNKISASGDLTTSDVPEPGSVPLMLGALGAMGWVSYRRKTARAK